MMHSGNSMADCLQEAEIKLQSALSRLEQREPLVEEQEDGAADTAMMVDDPEDLAAAFMAQQARLTQATNRLPVHEWAKAMHAHRAVSRPEPPTQGTPSPLANSTTREEMVNAMYEEFQKAFG
jgi:hypothetical protein